MTLLTAFSAFVDLYLATYPAFILFHLQMSLRKKIALSAAMGLGSMYAFEDSLELPFHPNRGY
jgi:hypothetical protein